MILLSFDVEEFDAPIEFGHDISFENQIKKNTEGLVAVLDTLKKENITATFFTTAQYAIHAPEYVKRIVDEGHELASHTYFHSTFSDEDYLKSKKVLEEKFGVSIYGFRMPRMAGVNYNLLQEAGYRYDSSTNPTYIPGRFNSYSEPTYVHKKEGLTVIPSAVFSWIHFPFFWITFRMLPFFFSKWFTKSILRKEGFINLYFHPWEFADISNSGLSFLFTTNAGKSNTERLQKYIQWAKKEGYSFGTIYSFLKKENHI